jgi:hypothetical protein
MGNRNVWDEIARYGRMWWRPLSCQKGRLAGGCGGIFHCSAILARLSQAITDSYLHPSAAPEINSGIQESVLPMLLLREQPVSGHECDGVAVQPHTPANSGIVTELVR